MAGAGGAAAGALEALTRAGAHGPPGGAPAGDRAQRCARGCSAQRRTQSRVALEGRRARAARWRARRRWCRRSRPPPGRTPRTARRSQRWRRRRGRARDGVRQRHAAGRSRRAPRRPLRRRTRHAGPPGRARRSSWRWARPHRSRPCSKPCAADHGNRRSPPTRMPPAPSSPTRPARRGRRRGRRRPESRRGSAPSCFSILAFPLAGAGLYILNRPRRLAGWVVTALALWALMIVAARVGLPKLFIGAMVGLWLVAFAGIVDTAFARATAPRTAGRAWLGAISSSWPRRGTVRRPESGSSKRSRSVGRHGTDAARRQSHLRQEGTERHRARRHRRVRDSRRPDLRLRQARRRGGRRHDRGHRRGRVDQWCGARTDRSRGPVLRHGRDARRPSRRARTCRLARETNARRSYTIMFEDHHRATDHPRTVVPVVTCS